MKPKDKAAGSSLPMLTAEVKRVVKSSPLLVRVAVPIFRAKSIVLAQLPVSGSLPTISEKNLLEVYEFSSLEDYAEWVKSNEELIATWEFEDQSSVPADKYVFHVQGHCALCDEDVSFVATTEYGSVDEAGIQRPKWREHLLCPRCNMRSRVRAALHIAIQECGMAIDSKIYITEQFGSNYRWLRGHFANVVGSEYLDPKKPSGSRTLGINHEDLHGLSFPSNRFNYVLSFDVLEHVPDYITAFSSIYRVLSSGGRFVMTVPFTIDEYKTTVRAIMHPDGRLEHLLPIEVHGNPTDPVNGALCYRNYGWDVLDRLRESGFAEAKVHVYHNRKLGYLGGPQVLISATKA